MLMWGSMSHWLSSVFVLEHSAVGSGAACPEDRVMLAREDVFPGCGLSSACGTLQMETVHLP